MRILAFDASTKFLTVALADNGETIGSFHEDVGMNQSTLLMPTIESILKEAGCALNELDGIAVGVGPGSFTGLRIAITTAKGLSMVSGVPVVGVPTLDLIAYNFIGQGAYLLPVLDARKNRVYACLYHSDGLTITPKTEYLLEPADALAGRITKKALAFGDGFELYRELFESRNKNILAAGHNEWYPKGEVLASLGAARLKAQGADRIDALVPMYLYPKECNVRGFIK